MVILARCGCGGNQCGCAVIAGDNVTIGGTGSAANPFVITAQTSCPEVRACLHGTAGVAYDQASGTFSAALSGQPGNNVTVNADGGLFVPTGAATVSTGCGLSGDGSGSAPVEVNTGTWPFTCSLDDVGGGVYCDASGKLRTDPPKQYAYVTKALNQSFNNVLVPSTLTTVVNQTIALVNPDPCRTAEVIGLIEVDGSFILPGGAGAAFAIQGDEVWYVHNEGTTTITSIHAQQTKSFRITVPPGGTVNQALTVGMTRGSGSARYNRVQWEIKAWLFT